MATSFAGIKPKFDIPSWQATPLIYSSLHVIQTAIAGATLESDRRASQYRNPNMYFMNSATTLFEYHATNNGWVQLTSPALAGTFGLSACAVYAPSLGPRGTIAAGSSTTQVVLSTALPAAVGANQMAGQQLRIVDNASGASGKTFEVIVLSNTAGTTPTVTFTAIANTPTTGSAYEFLSGRYYMLNAGVVAAGIWKYYDVLTSSYSGNLATTNLPASIATASSIISLDELHTPITGVAGVAVNGETGGYFGNLVCTASGTPATILFGTAAGGDSAVLANEYRNFQIRIIQDTTTPTSVGQRRRITSHTAGATPQYTVPAWTVNPSTGATFVIENNNDIILWTGATTTTYRYAPIADAWDTTTYAVKPAAMAAGCVTFHPFGIVLNTAKTLRHSYLYQFRGGVTGTLDVFDIAGATTGSWTSAVPYDNQGLVTFNASAGCAYSAVDNKTLLTPVSLLTAPVNFFYFDVDKGSLRPYSPCQQVPGTIVDGDRVAIDFFVDGTAKKAIYYYIPSTQSYALRSVFIL